MKTRSTLKNALKRKQNLSSHPYHIEAVLLGQVVDLTNRRVVQDGGVRVEASLVQVTVAIVGHDQASQLAIQGNVEALISGEDDDST